MAEIKTGIFAKNVQKRLSRAQEKVLQKLGKADETKDEQFEQCVQNFKRQEFEGSRLQREMKAYIAAVKGMQQASMNLTESLHEVYEPDWHGKDDVMTIGKNCDVLWEDFHQKLVDSTINNLETYLIQFPDLKTRVAKRSRKLIDYDSARHHLETLQTSAMRNDKKISKAEEDLKKAQRVFDDLNVGLQDELPTLWDSRVGFYVSTFKNVSGLEARFHREISFLCHKLYEVMNKLAEQHSDKMFTIQGAPSDSGPLRLARTPTPPDDDSPDSSPAASPNHTLRPISPGPPRPKSPSQLKMGPPKPPPPKATPTKELQQEQIIDLFDGGFPEISVTSPQLNEKPGESLLDMDFDPFKPDASTPIGQTQSPISQTLPWDLWTENAAQPAEPAADAGFTANWAADFGSSATTVTEESENAQPALDGQGWPPSEGWPTEAASEPQEEVATDEVRAWDTENYPEPNPDCDPCAVGGGEAKQQHPGQGQEGVEEGQTDWATNQVEWAEEKAGCGSEETGAEETVGLQPMPGIILTNEFGQVIQDATEGVGGDSSRWGLSSQVDLDGSGSECETAEEWGDVPGQNGGWVSADDELESAENENPVVAPEQGTVAQECFADWDTTADSFPKQITPADSLFGGDAFAANCDQPEAVPCVSELENESLDELHSDPSKAGANMPQNVLDSTTSSDPFGTEGHDPFGAGNDPFAASGDDPFGTGNDPFATPDQDQDPSGFSGSDPFSTTGSDLFGTEGLPTESPKTGFDSDQFAETQSKGEGQWAAEPFAAEFPSDPFATGGNQDPFANEIPSDPFANESSRDPFTNENSQGWAGSWESTGTQETIHERKESDVFDDKTGHGNGFAQWAAFPAPAADSENSSKGSWQEVSDSSGFFSSDGQGNFTAGWPGEAVPPQDPFASLPGPQDTSNPKGTIAVDQVGHKEPENSDLSEDEVANRRYGKLYQEIDTELEEVSNKAFNGFSKDATVGTFVAEFDKMSEAPEADVAEGEGEAPPASVPEGGEGPVTTPPTDTQPAEITASSPPAETATSTVESPVSAETEASEQAELAVEDIEKEQPSEEAPESAPVQETEKESPTEAALATFEDKESPIDETPEKMPIPSVVIEPASSNEGDDDRDGDLTSPIASIDNGVIAECQTSNDISSGMPTGYIFKVETLHDFDAANPDELGLKKGDIVLVVPTELAEDQDAGWLTGIREIDWQQRGSSAKKGLFPENFTQRLE
ncbi:hypothetical protein R3I93_007290 [Phoxinus phoxinus]|uniref:Amphiphysin n=1 Tax=Phoxinus phoxinus TaxID=58324 RepID=A0AAN9D6V7_9TELE